MTDGAHKDMTRPDGKLELTATPLEYVQLGDAVCSLQKLLKVHPELEDECELSLDELEGLRVLLDGQHPLGSLIPLLRDEAAGE